jgi:polyisoprenyl-phosphate glycosyltransferase
MLTIIIPVFNEEKNIKPLFNRLEKVSPSWQDPYELIFIDDGSTDGTLGKISELIRLNKHVTAIKLSRNFGHQAALSAGLKYAKGDAVIIMDGDLQDSPEALNRFIDTWRRGYHVVYAIRINRKEHLLKRISYQVFYKILAFLSDTDIPRDSGDFCLMDKKVVDVIINEMPEHNKFIRGLRAYAGFKQTGIKVERERRIEGKSKYTFRKLIKLSFDGLFDFSAFPLRIISYFGIFVSAFSFLIGLFFIFHRIIDFKVLGYSPKDVPGIASLATGIFFLGGIILIILGIIGEYIARIYFEVKKRPFYVVDEIIRNEH